MENNNLLPDQIQEKKQMTLSTKKSIMAYMFLTPSLLLFTVFTIIPLILSFIISATDYNGVTINGWVGFGNFITALNDKFFMGSIKNVLIFASLYVPLSIVVSLIVSFLISQIKVKQNFFKILFYIPSLTSGVAMIFVWRTLLTSSNTINFLDGRLAMVAVIAISVWSGLGGNMLIYLSAMQSIPKSVYEASSLDGASKFQQFIGITLPLLRPSTYFIFTTTLIGSFQLFDLVFLLTGGNNEYVTTPVIQIYYYATKYYQYGTGSAMSVILFTIIMIVTVITQIFVKEEKHESRRANLKKAQK